MERPPRAPLTWPVTISTTVTPWRPSADASADVAGDGLAVEHDHDVRLVEERLAARLETGAAVEAAREHLLELRDTRGDQAAAAGAVGGTLHLDVREPLRPLPARSGVAVGRDGDDQVLGGVQRGERPDHRAGRGTRGFGLTTDRQVVEGAERDRHRQSVQRAVRRQELLHRPGGQRLQLVDRRGVGGHERRGEFLTAQTDAYVREVGVPHPALPHPAALGHEGPQLLRGRVEVELRVALLTRGPQHGAPGLRQILQVVAPHVRQLTLGAASEADEHRDGHRDRRRDHDHAHDPHDRVRSHEEEDDGTAHAEHRQQLHHHPLLLPAGQLGRRLQLHLLARNFGGEGPRWALDDNVAHSSPIPLPDGTVPIGAPVATGSVRGRILLACPVTRGR